MLFKGDAKVDGSIPPGTTGKLILPILEQNTGSLSGDALALTARDPNGRELWTWVWPDLLIKSYESVVTSGKPAKVTMLEAAGSENITASVGDLTLQFNKKTGELAGVERKGEPFSFVNGPRLVTGDATLTSITQKVDGDDGVITAAYSGAMDHVVYRIKPNGWLSDRLCVYTLSGAHDFFGVGFRLPRGQRQNHMRYLGNGPATVYQNRLAGGMLDVWEKKYNDTMVGDPDNLEPGQKFDYPIFKGYYAGVRLATTANDRRPDHRDTESG